MVVSFPVELPVRTLRRYPSLVLCLAILGAPGVARAQGVQDPAAIEVRLPGLSGEARLKALATLTQAYRSVDPARAVELGEEAVRLADTMNAPGAKVTALNESAWALMELGRYEEAMDRAIQGQKVAEKEGLRSGLARARNNQGVIQRRLGNFGEALEHFRQSLIIYREIGDSGAVATSLNNLSVVYGFDVGDYDRALDAQLRALGIRERLGEPRALYQSYNTLGVIYDNLGDHPHALDYLRRALEGWRSLDLQPRIAATLGNMAKVYAETGGLQRALEAQREALAIRQSLEAAPGIASSEESIGNILARMGRTDEARGHLQTSLDLRTELGEQKNIAASLLSLARLDHQVGAYGDAERRLGRVLRIAGDIQARDVERTALGELSAVREARGDDRGALEAYRRWNALDDSLFSAERSQRIAAREAEFEESRTQQEMARLRTQAELATTKARRREAQLVDAVLLALVLILFYGRHVAKGVRKDLEHQVDQRTSELSAANLRLKDLILTDPLTGLRNRRYLLQTVEADLAVSLRAYRDARMAGQDPPAADTVFYIIDLDEFKTVNDEHGHAAGDRVLEQVARVLKETGRASDVVIRWGGEEFLIVSRQVDRQGAAVFAERVRQAVRGHVFLADEGVTLRKTCSIGFAVFPLVPWDPEAVSWDHVVGLADQAAYVAKRSGRDAWVGLYAKEGITPGLVRSDAARVARLVEDGALGVVSSREDGALHVGDDEARAATAERGGD
jgi:diguanylate cyclase (GGDEF)-like protein